MYTRRAPKDKSEFRLYVTSFKTYFRRRNLSDFAPLAIQHKQHSKQALRKSDKNRIVFFQVEKDYYNLRKTCQLRQLPVLTSVRT